jgi:hypothetical protein
MKNVTLFSQIIHCLDRNIFTSTLAKYKTDKHNKGINSWTHFISMLFCHLSKSQSIREITNLNYNLKVYTSSFIIHEANKNSK